MFPARPKVQHSYRRDAPRHAPCPRCGTRGHRKETFMRTALGIACDAILLWHVTTAEYRARCGCCTTFAPRSTASNPRPSIATPSAKRFWTASLKPETSSRGAAVVPSGQWGGAESSSGGRSHRAGGNGAGPGDTPSGRLIRAVNGRDRRGVSGISRRFAEALLSATLLRASLRRFQEIVLPCRSSWRPLECGARHRFLSFAFPPPKQRKRKKAAPSTALVPPWSATNRQGASPCPGPSGTR